MAPPVGGKQIKLTAVMYTMVLEELLNGPCTIKHLADHTGMQYHTVRRTLGAMHRRKLIHVCGYEIDGQGRATIRVFRWGEGKDAKRPIKTPEARKRDRAAKQTAMAINQAFYVEAA